MAKGRGKVPSKKASQADVGAFLEKVRLTPVGKKTGRPGQAGRLLFAMDATASRKPAWDMAAHIQGEMFRETAALGGLEIQLAYYRGFGEFKAGPWTTDEKVLLGQMTSVFCLAGQTDIERVLAHAINETRARKIDALVFVGDCFEEDIDQVGKTAGELGLMGVPAFMFHEGADPIAAFAFRQIAKLTNGAYCQFDANSAQVLKDLLGAVAVYAAGGPSALDDMARIRGGEVLKIAHQVKGG
ncbi:MAG: VWA domain-containing protein [Proteobacteria bacterium]|nr:VWA domain-containing protein [Pseudomonadota bacterium]